MPEDDTLAQETRRRIHDHVAAFPGQHMRELQRQLAMSAGTLEYHLRVLVREGVLAERRQGRYVRYFVAGQVGRAEKDVLSVLRQDVPRRICALLLMHPDQNHGGLLKHFQMAPSTLTFHMKKLLEAGLVESRREGRETRYRVVDPALVGKVLVDYQASFVDDLVDRFADVWLSVGAGLEAEAGAAEPPPTGLPPAEPPSREEPAPEKPAEEGKPVEEGASGGAAPGAEGLKAGEGHRAPGAPRREGE